MVIRKIEGDGLKRIAPLFKKIFTDCFSSHPVFEDAVRGETVYAAFINDEIAGFVSVWQEDLFIHFLAVDEKYRKMGIGRMLLGHVEKTFGRPLSLKCLKANAGAVSFYTGYGFKAVSEGDCPDGRYICFLLK